MKIVYCSLLKWIIMLLLRSSITFLILLVIISPITAHVNLLSPNGGETYNPGQIIQIEWREVLRHETLNWDILFSSDGGVNWDTVKSNIPLATMSYAWELPDFGTSEGRIKIVQDNVDADYEDISDDFIISSVTGLNQPNEVKKVKVYPNPITDFSLIEFENPGNNSYTFTLYDIRGQQLRTLKDIKTNKILLDLKDLSKGIYFFQLNSNTEPYSKGNFIVQ